VTQAPMHTALAAVERLATEYGVVAPLSQLPMADLGFLAGLPLTVTLRVDDLALSDADRARLYALLGLRIRTAAEIVSAEMPMPTAPPPCASPLALAPERTA